MIKTRDHIMNWNDGTVVHFSIVEKENSRGIYVDGEHLRYDGYWEVLWFYVKYFFRGIYNKQKKSI